MSEIPQLEDSDLPDLERNKGHSLNTVRHRMEARGETPAYNFEKILAGTLADPKGRELVSQHLLAMIGHEGAQQNLPSPQSVLPNGQAPATEEQPSDGSNPSAPLAESAPSSSESESGNTPSDGTSSDLPNLGAISAQVGPGNMSADSNFRAKAALQGIAYNDKLQGQRAMDAAQARADDVTLQHKEDMLRLADNYQRDMSELQTNYKRQVEGQLSRFQHAADEFRSINPNPWAQRGTAFTIGSAIAIGLNQMGLSMVGSNAPNQALEQIKNGLNRDLQVHQLQIAHAKDSMELEGNILAQMRSVFHDETTALQAARVALTQQVVARADAEMAKLLPGQRSAQSELFMRNLHAQQATDLQSLYDKVHADHGQDFMHEVAALTAKYKGQANALGYARLSQQARANDLRERQLNMNTPNDLFGTEVSLKNPLRKTTGKAMDEWYGRALPSYDKIRGLMKEAISSPEAARVNIGKMRGELENIKQAMRHMTESGMNLTESEQVINNAIAGMNSLDPEKWVHSEAAQVLLGAGYQRVRQSLDAMSLNNTGRPLQHWDKKRARLQMSYNPTADVVPGIDAPADETDEGGEGDEE